MTTISQFYKRTTYLLYYLKQMDWPKFWAFHNHAKATTGKNGIRLLLDAVKSVYRYNVGLIDYYYFRFFEKNHEERSQWMGTGYKYEYDLVMNPVDKRHILQNKIEFFKAFAPFVKHKACTIEDLEMNNAKADQVLQNASGKIAVKDALGQCGWDVEIVELKAFTRDSLIRHMKSRNFNLAEEFIVQHAALSKLSNTGLNTVRMITQINPNGEVDLIGPTLRITVNSPVDNMAVGNIAAPIDLKTGRICGPGAYQDIRKQPEEIHPVTKIPLVGYEIPFWNEVLELCRTAALHNTTNKSIGWDVAITENGPSFVEGNHNWCKLLWQLPAGRGLKSVLDDYRRNASAIVAVNKN